MTPNFAKKNICARAKSRKNLGEAEPTVGHPLTTKEIRDWS